jgi:hypothetical protein
MVGFIYAIHISLGFVDYYKMNKWELLLPLSKSLKHVFFFILPSSVIKVWFDFFQYITSVILVWILPLLRAFARVTKKMSSKNLVSPSSQNQLEAEKFMYSNNSPRSGYKKIRSYSTVHQPATASL